MILIKTSDDKEFYARIRYENIDNDEWEGRKPYTHKKFLPSLVTIKTQAEIFSSVTDAVEEEKPLAVGTAYCSELDNFKKETGRRIAVGRALSDLGYKLSKRQPKNPGQRKTYHASPVAMSALSDQQMVTI